MSCDHVPLRDKFYNMLFALGYMAGLTKNEIINCQVKIFLSKAYPNAGCEDNGTTHYDYSVFKIHTKCSYNYIPHSYPGGACIVEGEGRGPWDGNLFPPNKKIIEYTTVYALANILLIMTDECVGAGNWGSAELCGQANRQWICYKQGIWNTEYEPPEPPEPPPGEYEWDPDYNNIDCQVDSFPAQTSEAYPSQLFDNLMNAICCSPRPLFLICTNYNEELIASPYAFSIQFRLELYFPVISGSIAQYEGMPLEFRCIGHQYSFVYSIADPLIDSGEWQENVHRFVEQFNFINEQRLKIMLAGYGLDVQQQNKQSDESNYLDIDIEVMPEGKRGDRYTVAIDVIKKVFSYFHS